jgi:hypothetical protein
MHPSGEPPYPRPPRAARTLLQSGTEVSHGARDGVAGGVGVVAHERRPSARPHREVASAQGGRIVPLMRSLGVHHDSGGMAAFLEPLGPIRCREGPASTYPSGRPSSGGDAGRGGRHGPEAPDIHVQVTAVRNPGARVGSAGKADDRHTLAPPRPPFRRTP